MKIKLFNTFVNVFTKTEYINIFGKQPAKNNPIIIYYLNTYSLYLCNKHNDYAKAFNNADYITADGFSIVFALKKLFNKDAEKISPTIAFLDYLASFFEKENIRIFILAGENVKLKLSVYNIKKSFPSLNIVDHFNGFFKKDETDKIIERINQSGADILLVGMGMPKSEFWIEQNKSSIDVKYIMTVGAFVDFVSEDKKLAPAPLRNIGLEWLYRLYQEPKRLFSRYLIAHTFFVKIFMMEYFRKIKKRD